MNALEPMKKSYALEDFQITNHQLKILIAIKLLLIRNQDTSGKTVSELVKTTPQQARGLMHLLELKNMIKVHTKVHGGSKAWNFNITELGDLVLKANIQ
jgi:hypothetical protein